MWHFQGAQKNRLKQTLRSLKAYFGAMTCIVVIAAESGYAAEPHSCNIFCGARDQTNVMNLAPVRLMDDDQLFAAAESLRNRSVSAQQRLFNFYWLNQSSSNTIIGSRAISKLLSFSFIRYWRQDKSPWRKEDITRSSVETSALTTDWGSYRVRVSEDELLLKYHLRF